jgi:hypothetical protein
VRKTGKVYRCRILQQLQYEKSQRHASGAANADKYGAFDR